MLASIYKIENEKLVWICTTDEKLIKKTLVFKDGIYLIKCNKKFYKYHVVKNTFYIIKNVFKILWRKKVFIYKGTFTECLKFKKDFGLTEEFTIEY